VINENVALAKPERPFRMRSFVLDKAEYSPIDAEAVGNWFVFHELHLVYRRKP